MRIFPGWTQPDRHLLPAGVRSGGNRRPCRRCRAGDISGHVPRLPGPRGHVRTGGGGQVEVRFDRAVRAAGSPRVALTVGTQTRHATFSSWCGQSLYFDYTGQERDRDQDGTSIAANALSLDGGTIRTADSATDADLTHGAVAASSGNKVNGSLPSAPVVRGSAFRPTRSLSTEEPSSTPAIGTNRRRPDPRRGARRLHPQGRRQPDRAIENGAGGAGRRLEPSASGP